MDLPAKQLKIRASLLRDEIRDILDFVEYVCAHHNHNLEPQHTASLRNNLRDILSAAGYLASVLEMIELEETESCGQPDPGRG